MLAGTSALIILIPIYSKQRLAKTQNRRYISKKRRFSNSICLYFSLTKNYLGIVEKSEKCSDL